MLAVFGFVSPEVRFQKFYLGIEGSDFPKFIQDVRVDRMLIPNLSNFYWDFRR
jgi:hypothetical protein